MSRCYTENDECIKVFFSQFKDIREKAETLIKEYRPSLMGRRFVTDAQLSEKLNISRRTLQEYRDRGKIPFYRMDGKILYDESDVEIFLADSFRPRFEN